jgi:hypothetical protein
MSAPPHVLTRARSSSTAIRSWRRTSGTGASSACPAQCERKRRADGPPARPDVDFTCDIQFDPFLYMQDHNKTYGFTISLIEFVETIPTLWDATKGACMCAGARRRLTCAQSS